MRLAPLLLLLAAAPALANMANPVQPGTPTGEPAAALEGLRIAREVLTLDLRPLGRGREVGLVEALYRVVNEGPARAVPLDFLALGDDVRAAEVWVDERPVEARRVDTLAVPALWRIADSTPGLDGGPAPYEADETLGTPRGLRFEARIPPGQHTVRVRYRVRLGSYDSGDHPNRVWQLAYSLAPARLWAGFGQLDVVVAVPEGWEAKASVPLRREGSRLVGRFSGVPGDVLAVSTRAPAPALVGPLKALALGLPVVWVLLVGWVSGRLVARTSRGAPLALPGALIGGVLAAASFVGFWATAHDLGDSSAYGYGAMLGAVLVLGPVVLLGGIALTQAVAWATLRRSRASRPGGPA